MLVHFVVNTFRPAAVAATQESVAWLQARGVKAAVESDAAEAVGAPSVPAADLSQADLVVCMGGDGTLIRAAHLVSRVGTPILGVNYGRFGFVCPCPPSYRHTMIEAFLEGEADSDTRAMVETTLLRGGKEVARLHSLNEAAVQRAATTRLLTFEVSVNGMTLARYPADGVMVATPTGSTAYNLSAGGPIVHPSVKALVLSAIMPHTLAARSLVVDEGSVVDIDVETRGDAVLSCDGHSRLTLLSGDAVRIQTSDRITRVVRVEKDDFLMKLAERLSWSRRWPDEPEESC